MRSRAKEQLNWLEQHFDYQKDACLIWPFGRYGNGYGYTARFSKKRYLAHRWVCEKIKGPPPTKKHNAAHSCGKGHLGCVSPIHLGWKTNRENHLDRRKHGTSWKRANKITPKEVIEIRRLKGQLTQREIGQKFGLCRSAISMIHSRNSWSIVV